MLTPIQKAEIAKLSPSVGMYMLMQKYVYDYQNKLEKLEQDFSRRLEAMREEALETFQAVRAMQKGDKPVAGIDYHIPKDGDSPSEEDLLALIEPLIPQVKDGHTPTKDELLELIKPLIPPSQNRALLVQDILSQLNLPEIPTPDAIVEMVLQRINERKLAIQDIEGLQNELQTLKKNLGTIKQRKKEDGGGSGSGGGMSNMTAEIPSGTINGVNTTFTLTSRVGGGGKAIWVLLNGQTQEYGTHYTVSGKTLTMLFAPAGQPQPDTLFVQYFRA